MSEEILKALMQLFAIIVKQDDGVHISEKAFVEKFLKQQLSPERVSEYFALFNSFITESPSENTDEGEKKKKLTSVRDSVKTLSICKKINKTLTQKQKIVVLVRLFELLNQNSNSEGISSQRKEIIDTVSNVFNILPEEFSNIEKLCQSLNYEDFYESSNFLIVGNISKPESAQACFLHNEIDKPIVILKLTSEDMYFLKYFGESTFNLNGIIVNRTQIQLLAPGSTLRPSHGETIYYSDVQAHFLKGENIAKIQLEAQNLEYKFPNGAVGLRNIEINEQQGRLIAIMGGSGAGKTTLLNVMAGLESPSNGFVKVNGINLHTENQKLEGVIGYVAQDDILFEELTVYQNLLYNAELCFKDLDKQSLDDLVNKTLKSLGLFEIKDIKVGNVLNKKISGGQRKRLNIALELIREPAIMFLDEPTSGLSSRDSENVIDLLKELTLKGKLIFVVIHQPSSDIYKMFDKVVILDVGGYQIYYGNPVNAVTYFKKLSNQINAEEGQCSHCGNVNPESVFNTIDAKVVDEFGNLTEKRKVSPTLWNEYFKTNIRFDKLESVQETPPKSLNLPNKLKQFLVFVKRDVLSKLSNTQYLLINLLEAPLLALILAFIIRYVEDPSGHYHYSQNENIPAFLFMAIIVAMFMGLTVSAEEIIRDAKILKRETFLNLSRFSYLSSKVTILFTLSLIQTFCFVVIGNLILGIKDMTISYWMMLFSVSCSANMLGLIISASFNSAVTIYILIPILLIPQMILSGAIFSFDKLNTSISNKDKVPVIADAMISRWAFEGLAVKQFKDNKFEQKFFEIEKLESEADYINSYWANKLNSKADETIDLINGNKNAEKVKSNVEFIKTELVDKSVGNNEIDLKTINFKNPKVADIEGYKNIIKSITHYSSLKYIEANTKKDAILNKFNSDPQLQKLYNETKEDYYNESLADLVKKQTAKNKIIEYNGKYLQVMDPIFKNPDESNKIFSFDTHLYTPYKFCIFKKIDTFLFNILMIWIMTTGLFLILYFNLLKKILEIKIRKN
ncbi:MAG: ATP-binding cassette domain-containing protein [Cytophagales bacterium]